MKEHSNPILGIMPNRSALTRNLSRTACPALAPRPTNTSVNPRGQRLLFRLPGLDQGCDAHPIGGWSDACWFRPWKFPPDCTYIWNIETFLQDHSLLPGAVYHNQWHLGSIPAERFPLRCKWLHGTHLCNSINHLQYQRKLIASCSEFHRLEKCVRLSLSCVIIKVTSSFLRNFQAI